MSDYRWCQRLYEEDGGLFYCHEDRGCGLERCPSWKDRVMKLPSDVTVRKTLGDELFHYVARVRRNYINDQPVHWMWLRRCDVTEVKLMQPLFAPIPEHPTCIVCMVKGPE